MECSFPFHTDFSVSARTEREALPGGFVNTGTGANPPLTSSGNVSSASNRDVHQLGQGQSREPRMDWPFWADKSVS